MSPIRVSNQVSPKTKVVDLSFFYNFYFGQISSCYMKFGVSVNQNQVKILKFDHCALQCLHCAAPTPSRRLAAGERRLASAITPRRRSSSALSSPRDVSVFLIPFLFLELLLRRARARARRRPSRRPTLTTLLRFRAPGAARPHLAPTPPLPEPVRVVSRPNRAFPSRPPLLSSSTSAPSPSSRSSDHPPPQIEPW